MNCSNDTISVRIASGRKRRYLAEITKRIRQRFRQALNDWLNEHSGMVEEPTTDFRDLRESIRAGDVVLVAGQTRISRFITWITGSAWTHVALCVGRLDEITDPRIRDRIALAFPNDSREPVLIEALLGHGTVLTPLSQYRGHNLKLCHPRGLSQHQVEKVIGFSIRHLGYDYDLRLILDLARFLCPWPLLPRRWRSSVFVSHSDNQRKCICSTMLVQSFVAIGHPVIGAATSPAHLAFEASLMATPRLATPKDFDESPYFEQFEFPNKPDLRTLGRTLDAPIWKEAISTNPSGSLQHYELVKEAEIAEVVRPNNF